VSTAQDGRLLRLPVLLGALAAIVCASEAGAATIHVPAEQPTLTAAVAAAVDGDTIDLAAGTYDESVLTDKSLTIMGPTAGVPASGRDPGLGDAIIRGTVYFTVGSGALDGVVVQDLPHVAAGRVVFQGSGTVANSIVAAGVYMDTQMSPPHNLDVHGSGIESDPAAIWIADFGHPGAQISASIVANDLRGGMYGVILPISGSVTIAHNRIGSATGLLYTAPGPAMLTVASNWWGCNGGPPNPGCVSNTSPVADSSPLHAEFTATPAVIGPGGQTSTIRARFLTPANVVDAQFAAIRMSLWAVPLGSISPSMGVTAGTGTATLTSGAATGQTTVYGAAGGSALTASVNIANDLSAPSISFVEPIEGGRYSLFKDVRSSYNCADTGGSGLVSCTGTVANGAAIPRGSLGTKTFTVTAVDGDGNSTTKSVTYRVMTFGGMFLDDDPVGYWRLGDQPASSVIEDTSTRHRDGEFKNSQQSSPLGISADTDRSRVFFGSSGYGFVRDVPSPPEHAYTMEAFVSPSAAGSMMVMQHGGGGALLIDRSGHFAFRQTGTTATASAITAVPGQWYHVVGRWDGFRARIDVRRWHADHLAFDSTFAEADSARGPIGTPTLYIGFGDQAPWCKCALDEVAYYFTALSDRHVLEHFYADPPPRVARAVRSRTIARAKARAKRH
jgi:hypothetical protein